MNDPTKNAPPDEADSAYRRPLGGLLAAFFAVYLAKGLSDPTVHLADFFAHLYIAGAIGTKAASELTSPWFPIGYPFLLKVATALAPRPVPAAHLLAAACAVLALWALYRVARNVTGQPGLALLVVACTGMSPPHLLWAAAEGSDMPFLAALLWACAFLTGPVPRVFAAGLAAGLAYDCRYAATAPIAAIAVWLAAIGAPRADLRGRVRQTIEFALGALLASSPQLLLTLWVHGTPVRTFMVKNIWFGIYGQNNWQSNWDLVPDDIGMLTVIRQGPGLFLRHWTENLAGLAIGTLAFPGRIVGHAINWLLPFGLIHTAFRLRRPAAGLWYWVTGVYAAALSLAFLGSRYYLPLVPALELSACWFLWDTLPAELTIAGRRVRARALGVALLLALKVPLDLLPAMELGPSVRAILAVDAALRQAGMTHCGEVLAASSDFYDVETLGRFTRWEANAPEPVADLAGLVAMMRRRGYRFAVYDREYGQGKVLPQLSMLLEPGRVPKEMLECVSGQGVPDGVAVYRLAVTPAAPGAGSPRDGGGVH